MSKTKKNSEMSLEELQTSYKKLKPIVSIGGGFMICAAAFMIYVAIKTQNYAFIAVAIGSSISFIPLVSQFAQIKKEIESRSKSNF